MSTSSALAALAQVAPGRNNGFLVMMIYLLGFGLIFWFLVLRPQRKVQQRHQEMVAALKKGDEVMTEGGILGSVVHIADDRVTIKTAENTRIVVARPKIARIMGALAPAAEEKS
ncbi:MAG: preprotein translocase subunit YajC [Longimicrobiales bacterium]